MKKSLKSPSKPPHKKPVRKKISAANRILSSLQHLYASSLIKNNKPILEISMDLCSSICALEGIDLCVNGENDIGHIKYLVEHENLKGEVPTSILEDIEMIIDATLKLCTVNQYLQLRGGDNCHS